MGQHMKINHDNKPSTKDISGFLNDLGDTWTHKYINLTHWDTEMCLSERPVYERTKQTGIYWIIM